MNIVRKAESEENMKKTHKYFIHKIEHPSGEWESIKLHRAFNAKDLADKFCHSEIWLKLPPEFAVFSLVGRIEGTPNCWVHWNTDKNDYDKYYTVDPEKFQQQNKQLQPI